MNTAIPLPLPPVYRAALDMTHRPTLSVVIPAFNEAERLPPTLADVSSFLRREGISHEILVVDDGSSDGTAGIVGSTTLLESTVRVIRLPRNRGKGYAVRTGVLAAAGEFILFADADGSTPITEYLRLREWMDRGAAVAIGSRAVTGDDTEIRALWYRKLLGRTFNFVVNLIAVPGVRDTQCGFKLFTRRAARFLFSQQRSDRFGFDVELLLIAQKAALPIAEVAVNWKNVPGSKVNLVRDSLKMLSELFVYRIRHFGVTPERFRSFEPEETASRSE